MPGQELSPNVEEYMEEIYRLSTEGEASVSTGDLADRLGVRAPSVTEMLGSLAEKGLVDYGPYRGAVLTDLGYREGRRLVEKHRLVERLLTDVIGLDWSEVHDEACELEHAISDELEEKIREALENPETCPHGKPVKGRMDDVSLDEVEPGGYGIVTSVSDGDPELLQELKALGVVPGAEVEVVRRLDNGETVLRVDGTRVLLNPPASGAVRVEPANPPEPG
ncbi:MAG: Transcriptional regulator MntR [Methanonatronarchaeales archaeon]|nr:Transcriptional regulator MntR [Methanonatronarchaeales archaeon]